MRGLKICEGHWLAAREAFEKLRPDLTELLLLPAWQTQHLQKWQVQQMQIQADWIGLCYGLSGNADRQLEAFRRAVAIDPLFTPAHAGIAEILLANGQINNAIDEYRQVVKSEGAGAKEWIQLARMLIYKPSPQHRGPQLVRGGRGSGPPGRAAHEFGRVGNSSRKSWCSRGTLTPPNAT